MTPGVVVDLGAGRALVGDRVLPVRSADQEPVGALVVRESVIRPLRFGERLRLVADALDDARALAAAVLAAACSTAPPPGERAAFEALALHLAGAHAGDDPIPGFAVCAGLISRAYGWSAESVADAEAAVVDRLALAVAGPPPGDDGWTRIVLAPDPGAPSGDDVGATSDAVRDDLARDLLRRGAEPFVALLPVPSAGTTGRPGVASEEAGGAGATASSPPARDRASARRPGVAARDTGPLHDHVPDHAVPDHAVPDHASATTSPERRAAAGAEPEPWPHVRARGDRTAGRPPGTRTAPTSPATAGDDRAVPRPRPEHTLPPVRPAADQRPWPEPIVTGPAWLPGSPHLLAGPEAPAAFPTGPSRASLAGRGAAWTAPAQTTASAAGGAPTTGAPMTPTRAHPGPASTVEYLAVASAAALPAAAREATAADVAALADHLAALLDDEADLRGIRP